MHICTHKSNRILVLAVILENTYYSSQMDVERLMAIFIK